MSDHQSISRSEDVKKDSSESKQKDTTVSSEIVSSDFSSGTIALKSIQSAVNDSPRSTPIAQLQAKADAAQNNTGLPDNLKTGMESLSGMSLDDVKVHHNSDKPAQLQAHAYAQGTDIHLGPGQEKHLPHELGHVVQQKQGRVKPTLQMKGKVNVNDDAGLEKEADVMGAKALSLKTDSKDAVQKKEVELASNSIVQRLENNKKQPFIFEPLETITDNTSWLNLTSFSKKINSSVAKYNQRAEKNNVKPFMSPKNVENMNANSIDLLSYIKGLSEDERKGNEDKLKNLETSLQKNQLFLSEEKYRETNDDNEAKTRQDSEKVYQENKSNIFSRAIGGDKTNLTTDELETKVQEKQTNEKENIESPKDAKSVKEFEGSSVEMVKKGAFQNNYIEGINNKSNAEHNINNFFLSQLNTSKDNPESLKSINKAAKEIYNTTFYDNIKYKDSLSNDLVNDVKLGKYTSQSKSDSTSSQEREDKSHLLYSKLIAYHDLFNEKLNQEKILDKSWKEEKEKAQSSPSLKKSKPFENQAELIRINKEKKSITKYTETLNQKMNEDSSELNLRFMAQNDLQTKLVAEGRISSISDKIKIGIKEGLLNTIAQTLTFTVVKYKAKVDDRGLSKAVDLGELGGKAGKSVVNISAAEKGNEGDEEKQNIEKVQGGLDLDISTFTEIGDIISETKQIQTDLGDHSSLKSMVASSRFLGVFNTLAKRIIALSSAITNWALALAIITATTPAGPVFAAIAFIGKTISAYGKLITLGASAIKTSLDIVVQLCNTNPALFATLSATSSAGVSDVASGSLALGTGALTKGLMKDGNPSPIPVKDGTDAAKKAAMTGAITSNVMKEGMGAVGKETNLTGTGNNIKTGKSKFKGTDNREDTKNNLNASIEEDAIKASMTKARSKAGETSGNLSKVVEKGGDVKAVETDNPKDKEATGNVRGLINYFNNSLSNIKKME